ncbi:MAG: hypothetical protein HRU36_03725 [Rickettsiales bacterium]|nr:hypothetical protein [Rickettsiales bacterium]
MTQPSEPKSNYKPLIIIVIFCLLLSIAQTNPFNTQIFMYYIMGYFFVFFSLFKFFDLKGFVEGFATYDIITKHFRIYGYIYPFIEFTLGTAYLSQINLLIVNWITLIVMLISGIGVSKSVLSGQKIKCACLGTVLNVPLSTVSILENFVMATMAAYQLYYFYV